MWAFLRLRRSGAHLGAKSRRDAAVAPRNARLRAGVPTERLGQLCDEKDFPAGPGAEPAGVAGMAGLEPASEGVKVPCLTTWLHPCVKKDQGLGSLPIPDIQWGG